MIQGSLCTDCNVRVCNLFIRPAVNGTSRFINVGKMCKQCRDYIIKTPKGLHGVNHAIVTTGGVIDLIRLKNTST